MTTTKNEKNKKKTLQTAIHSKCNTLNNNKIKRTRIYQTYQLIIVLKAKKKRKKEKHKIAAVVMCYFFFIQAHHQHFFFSCFSLLFHFFFSFYTWTEKKTLCCFYTCLCICVYMTIMQLHYTVFIIYYYIFKASFTTK